MSHEFSLFLHLWTFHEVVNIYSQTENGINVFNSPNSNNFLLLLLRSFFSFFFFILNVETSLSNKAERNLSGGSFAALILQIHRGHSFLAYFHLTRIASRDRSRPTKWKSYISRDETSSVFTSTGDPLILYDYDFQR